jgi:hypothetical protein
MVAIFFWGIIFVGLVTNDDIITRRETLLEPDRDGIRPSTTTTKTIYYDYDTNLQMLPHCIE